MKEQKETAFCRRHPTSFLGKDQFGNWYARCVTGNRFNEDCEIIVEKEVDKNDK